VTRTTVSKIAGHRLAAGSNRASADLLIAELVVRVHRCVVSRADVFMPQLGARGDEVATTPSALLG
jgi:hypothetical protein